MGFYSSAHPEDRHFNLHEIPVTELELIEKMRSSGTPNGLIPYILEQIVAGNSVTVGRTRYFWRDE